MFERQLRALGCSGEALRRAERDAEIAAHGRPTIAPEPGGPPLDQRRAGEAGGTREG
jgi:hypothetical protein